MKQELPCFQNWKSLCLFHWMFQVIILNATNLAEIDVEKGATTLLIPLNARKQLNDLSDKMITKINIQYYTDLKDCLIKALLD